MTDELTVLDTADQARFAALEEILTRLGFTTDQYGPGNWVLPLDGTSIAVRLGQVPTPELLDIGMQRITPLLNMVERWNQHPLPGVTTQEVINVVLAQHPVTKIVDADGNDWYVCDGKHHDNVATDPDQTCSTRRALATLQAPATGTTTQTR